MGGLVIGGVEGPGNREGQADGVPPKEFREPLPESLARDCPDDELPIDLIVGEEVDACSRDELHESVDDVLVDIVHGRQVDEIHCGPGEEHRVPDIPFPLGDILKHDCASLLPVLERRRDHLHLVERLSVAVVAAADVGDHLLPLETLDDSEGFRGGDGRDRRIADVLPDKFLFRAPKVPEKLVVCLDDREVGVEDQDGVLCKTEESRERHALCNRVDLCVPDKTGLDLARHLHDLKVLRDRVPVHPKGPRDLGDCHTLRPEPEGSQDSSGDLLLGRHTRIGLLCRSI